MIALPQTFADESTMTIQCAWCGALRISRFPERWSSKFTTADCEKVSHSICPVCYFKEFGKQLIS